MSLPFGANADYLVDRRKLRRKVTFWRVLAVLIAAAAVIALGVGGRTRLASEFTPHIARVKISGLITGDATTLRLLKDVEDSKASALILEIESPGGTTVGSERIYDGVRRVAAKGKPVVAVVDTLAASGAYIAALGSDHIVAYGNSIVGSIGVLFQFPNFTNLLDKVGVQVESVKSSPLKAAPSGFEPTSEAARAALASLVDDSFAWFKGLVKERRSLNDAELAAVSDGRVFTGRQGLPLKLIDQIGTETDAVAWLEAEKKVTKGLPIRDYKPQPAFGRLDLFRSVAGLADTLGWPSFGHFLRAVTTAAAAPRLDGLLSVWQGAAIEQ